jgi:hypothetical protein
MARAVPFTQASVRRAIAAAEKAGLQVTAIKPDGTVLVARPTNPQPEKPIAPDSEVVL